MGELPAPLAGFLGSLVAGLGTGLGALPVYDAPSPEDAMTWIRTLPDDDEVVGARKELYEAMPSEYAQDSDRLSPLVRADSITLAHSLIPGAMKHFFLAVAALYDPSLPLGRREHELIATTVSAINTCRY